MKKTIIFFVICLIAIQINAQIQPQVKKNAFINQEKINSSNQILLNQIATKNPLTKPLPDLKFTAFNVAAVSTAGAATYTLNITCTVKNDGTASVLTDDVSLQGFISDLDWIQKSQDVSFTNHFKPAGGRILSDIPNRGENLAPGASKQISYSIFNVSLLKDPKPVYLIGVNLFSNLQEISKDNNKTYMTILL